MISFRYHIASLVAVLLALAAGVALGAGPLQDGDEQNSAGGTTSPTSAGTADRQRDAFGDAFAASLQPSLLGGRLKGRAVTMLVLPGASQDEVAGLTGALAAGGASLAGTIRVDAALVDVSNKQLVDELGGQLEAAVTKVTIAAGAASYERLGVLLAYAVGTKRAAGDAVDEQGKGVLAGLSTAGLIATDGDLARRGNLILVVGGPPVADAEKAQGMASIVRSLAGSLDAATGGVVVAAPASAAGATGVLTGVRGDVAVAKAVSTVDSADTPAGAIVTVLAMAEQVAGAAGHYGGGAGATGPRPGVASN